MELANKAPSATKSKEDKSAFPISLEPHQRFVREHSSNVVLSATQNMGLVLDCSLVTKEIAGGVHFHSFPIPLLQGSVESLVRIFGVVGHSLFFQSILASCFLGPRNVFGRNEVLEMDNGAMTKVAMQVEVAAPTYMVLKLTSDVLDGDSFHIDVETKDDYSMHVRLRNHPALNPAATQIAAACHSLPLLCYFLLQSICPFRRRKIATVFCKPMSTAKTAPVPGAPPRQRAVTPTSRPPTPSHGARATHRPQRLGKQLPDRYIPMRSAMRMDYCTYAIAEPIAEGTVASGDSLPTHQDMLFASLLATPEDGTRLLRYRPRPRPLSPAVMLRQPMLREAQSGRHIPTAPTRILDAPELRDDYYLNLVAWGSANLLAVALGQLVYLYNVETGSVAALPAATGPGDYVTSVVWTSARQLAVGTCKAALQLWDVGAGKPVRTLPGHAERIGALAFHGTLLASGSRDTQVRLLPCVADAG
ncbi:anaphase promoting complex protein [Achlya hypogyna]|uniref:Anaphase promoting complex protein n=1 Tax=Achlya hypogyna TaxID=1202772 RepID=A0A1V9ZCT9_ACHHY|nr:anaphase promoting complex protein [Achlya hypogyna]